MSATLTFRYDSPAVDGPRELRFGPGRAAGPNLISDDTTLGTLTDAVADALALLATNAAGTAARKVAITSIVRAILQATDAAGVRAAIGLGTLATQSGTFSGTHSGTSSGTNTGDQDLSGYALTSAVPGLAPVQSVAGRTGVVAVAAADVTDSTATGRAVLTGSSSAGRDALGFVSLTTLGTTGAVSIDVAANTGFVLSLTGNVTLSLTNEADGRRFTLFVRGQASGYGVTWWGGLKWPGGAAPTIPTTSGRVMPVGFVRLASGEWLGIPGTECY